VYEQAIAEAKAVCATYSFRPRFLDCGGGLPPPYVLMKRGTRYDASMNGKALAAMYRRILRAFEGLEALWLENGRFLLARSGVLVIRILDIKNRGGIRQLICDGGRTMNALLSTWENHELQPVIPRRGQSVSTVVHGPTCMAFDQLGFRPLPKALRAGDTLAWFDAGAYHLPWETHFSHGLAEVWWTDEHGIRRERNAESFDQFWGRWNTAE
jgi:diaminopimelate decarboxylase